MQQVEKYEHCEQERVIVVLVDHKKYLGKLFQQDFQFFADIIHNINIFVYCVKR